MSGSYSGNLSKELNDKLILASSIIREVRENISTESLDCPDQFDNCFYDGKFCGELDIALAILARNIK